MGLVPNKLKDRGIIVNKKKITSMVLCAALASSLIPTAGMAADAQAVTGSIKATLRFDYPQLRTKVQEKNISITMYREGEVIGEIPLGKDVTGEISDKTQTVEKNIYGVELTNEPEIGYFDVNIADMPLGEYSFAIKGDGYTPYKTKEITLDDYSQHVVLGTGDKTFSIGDVNNDGTVTVKDRDLMTKSLGKTDAESLAVYDLNGDGKINIIDLAYVNHQIGDKGREQVFDTALLASKVVKADKISDTLAVSGTIGNIFNENNASPVSLGLKDKNQELTIPIEFNKATEMEQIAVVSPDATGAVEAGVATVTYEDENGNEITEDVHFDSGIPEGVELLSAVEGTRSVVISLGKRVAVKKIVINVTKVKDKDGHVDYAVVQEIKFLKDIVPENPAPQNLTVKNVKAEPLNESVKITWNEFPNISGYTVYYGLENGVFDQQLSVDTNSALIQGLKNLKTYYFTVVPTSDGWEGGRSEVVSAIPQPNAAPKKPDMVSVTEMDQALSLSWKETENATYYKVFYKEKDSEEAYVQFGDKVVAPKVIINNLKNNTYYYVYIIAGNDIGEGPASAIVEGMPQKIEVKPPEIPTLHMIDKDNIESVVMTNGNNYNREEYPNGFDVWNVADGDFGTHWTARVFWESSEFTFTFKEAKEMNYMVYAPRQDGNYRKSLDKYSIAVWDESGNKQQLVSGKTIPINSGTTGYTILPFEKTKVKKLSVSLAQWAGSPTGVSLSEAIFYESDNLAEEVRGLFANNIYTELSEEAKADTAATKQKIESLRAQANDAAGYYVDKDVLLDELNLAEALLNGDTSAIGRVKNGVESRNAGADGSKYKQSASDFQSLGVVAYATSYAERNKFEDTKVTIYAQIPEGETVSVVPTQYFAEASAWQGGAIPLQNGRNIIEIPQIGSHTTERGGALYLKYSGANPDQISLQIRQGAISIPALELADWYNIDEAERKERIGAYVDELETHVNGLNKKNIDLRIANSTEISMPNVLLSVAAAPVLSAVSPTGATREAKINTLYNNVLAWEEMMHVCNTTQGIDGTLENSDMQSRQNIRYMRMFGNAFMYAAGRHIGIGYGSCSGMVCGKPVSTMAEGEKSNKLFGWGIAHEIGHNMDKLGKAEITNNIYSLMAQTYDGKQNTLTSRLESSNKYAGIYKKVAEGRPGLANDVFVQLGMYWQLHLAYDDGDNPMDFYNKLFKEWKNGSISAPTGDEKFALTASKIANKNLTEFFEKWGMVLSDATKQTLAAYPEETRKIQYLNDNARRYRLNGGVAATGETTAKAELDSENEKQINLTFSTAADKESVLGWEISRNGKTVAFVPYKADAETVSGTYADIIGSANNQAFGYTVQAVDMLGNKIGNAIDAGQVRISYVKTVDPNSYTMTRTDNKISVEMKDQTAVSGLKITNAPASGSFTVSVTREVKNEETGDITNDNVTAKNGDFSKNEISDASYYVTYFNKPGADSSDTRIWTYDAKSIEIEGIPADASVEFISYAGDNIEFTSDAAVGRLKNDYVYGDDEDEVIKAGTLVVTGTYRGDPLYNTIEVEGSYIAVDPETNEETVTNRPVDGYSLLFAEIPEDGEVSDISDGIFIFVPNIQKEAELQNKGDAHDCSAQSLLPARIQAAIYRTDTIDSADKKRLTSNTIWIDAPSDEAMPEIILE